MAAWFPTWPITHRNADHRAFRVRRIIRIPIEKAEIVKQKRPDVPVYIYPAGHGFSCDARSAYEPVSAKLAWERTLKLFAENVG